MKKTQLLSLLYFAVVFLCGEPTSFATVRGSSFSGPPFPMCGAAEGTLYTNLTGSPINFDLSFSFSVCTATLSWTDADGHVQTFTLGPSERPRFATSLPAGGAISWSTSGIGEFGGITWTLGTAGGPSPLTGGGGTCGTTGATYFNLTANPIYFDLAFSVFGVGCGLIFSWTDADGQAQEIAFSASGNTPGASTSLPPGGVISWALGPGAGGRNFSLDVERVPTTTVLPATQR